MAEGEVPGTAYGTSKNGWVDSELFELWFKHHFLMYAPPAWPLLLGTPRTTNLESSGSSRRGSNCLLSSTAYNTQNTATGQWMLRTSENGLEGRMSEILF